MAYLRKRDYYNIGIISLFPLAFFTTIELLTKGSAAGELVNSVYSIIYSAIITFGLYITNSLIVRWLQIKHPWQSGVAKRVILE